MQIWCICPIITVCKEIKSKHYSEKKKSIEEFKCLLNKEPWQEKLQALEVNSALQVFMDFLVITAI